MYITHPLPTYKELYFISLNAYNNPTIPTQLCFYNNIKFLPTVSFAKMKELLMFKALPFLSEKMNVTHVSEQN